MPCKLSILDVILGTSLVVQWLRLRAPNAGGPGSIPGQGTRSRMLQRRSQVLQLKTRLRFTGVLFLFYFFKIFFF